MTDYGHVLSDVHIECQSETDKDYAVTRFKFHLQVPNKQPSYSQECLPTYYHKKCQYCVKNLSKKCPADNYDASNQPETKVANSLQYDSDGDLIVERPSQQYYEDIEPVRKKRKIVDKEWHLPKSENKKILEKLECDENEKDKESCYSNVGNNTSTENLTDALNEQDDDNKKDDIRNSYGCEPHVLDSNTSGPITDKCMNNSEVLPIQQDCKDCTSNNEIFFINIKHSLATNLQDVGRQVWHGAMLLSDFLIHHADTLYGKTVVDFGAGVGLTSIIAAMFAKTVYSTDTGDNVLSLNEDNVVSAKTYPTLPHSLCQISVKDVDWFDGLKVKQTRFGLSSDDVKYINTCDILLAADVIYDFDIIDAFFDTIKQVMVHPPSKTLYISLEKRMVFSVEDLKITSPAYNYFRLLLDKLETETSESNIQYKVTSLGTDFQQYFQYNKSKYLELWCISSKIEHS